eukprot:scaffold39964_cov68-Phaeocystis_antarctica.AAC.4
MLTGSWIIRERFGPPPLAHAAANTTPALALRTRVRPKVPMRIVAIYNAVTTSRHGWVSYNPLTLHAFKPVAVSSVTRSRCRRRPRRAAGRAQQRTTHRQEDDGADVAYHVPHRVAGHDDASAAQDGGGGLGLESAAMQRGASSVMWEAAAQHFQVVGAL